MFQVTLTIGHNINNVPKLDTQTICKQVTNVLQIQAYTAIPCFGMWEGIAEQSTRIEIVTDDHDIVTGIVSRVPALCAVLMQDAIMVSVNTDARVTFVSRDFIAA